MSSTQLPESELLLLVVTVGSGIPFPSQLQEMEFRFRKPEFHSGSRSFIWDDGVPIRNAEVLFGMTEFRLRQYSPIKYISVAGIGIPASRFHPSCWKWSSNSGSRSFIREAEVPTPSILI
ncbi:MAG: hypothetical protein WBI06_00620 [Paludibacter sp.]